jgi:nitrate reductase alpha subunit
MGTPHAGGPLEELLTRSGRFFTPGEFSKDLRTVTRRGGREAVRRGAAGRDLV